MITANTEIYGVIGDPIGHTMSPIIHNTIFSLNSEDAIYLAFNVKSDKLNCFINTIDMLGIKGFNVTMPHKQSIMKYLDHIDEQAVIYGSVNTVAVKDGKLYGYCTDPEGFFMSLQKAGVDVIGKNIVFLGAGGVSRSVSLMLAKKGAKKITVLNRTLQKAQELKDNILKYEKDFDVSAYPLDFNDMEKYLKDCDILINSTPLGMKHNPQFQDLSFLEYLKKDAVVYDMIYNPMETEFIKTAKLLGHKTISGLYMLIYQGVIASKLFYGKPIKDIAIELMVNMINEKLEQK